MRPVCVAIACVILGVAGIATSSAISVSRPLEELEGKLERDPESLTLGAEYRRQIIAAGAYDRSIKLFERLSKRPQAGANAFLNLAFAYVDRVPAASAIRQVFLGRDAIGALTKSISIRPTALAYLVRGLVNLYYDKAVFHRTDKGVADLEEARRWSSTDPRAPYAVRIFVALGDGYWRLDQPIRARQVWREGLVRFPADDRLRDRLDGSDDAVRRMIAHALDADVRVDTSLRDVFPDVEGGAFSQE